MACSRYLTEDGVHPEATIQDLAFSSGNLRTADCVVWIALRIAGDGRYKQIQEIAIGINIGRVESVIPTSSKI